MEEYSRYSDIPKLCEYIYFVGYIVFEKTDEVALEIRLFDYAQCLHLLKLIRFTHLHSSKTDFVVMALT